MSKISIHEYLSGWELFSSSISPTNHFLCRAAYQHLGRHQRPAPHQLQNNPQAAQPTLSSFTAPNVSLLPLHSYIPRQSIVFPDDVQEMRDPEARDEPGRGALASIYTRFGRPDLITVSGALSVLCPSPNKIAQLPDQPRELRREGQQITRPCTHRKTSPTG